MPGPEVSAGLPGGPRDRAMASTVSGLALVWLVVAVSSGAAPLRSVGGAVVVAGVFGPGTWLVHRRRLDQRLSDAPVVDGTAPIDARGRAQRLGVVLGVVVAVALAVVVPVTTGLLGDLGTASWVGPGLLLGLGLSTALADRDTRRWERRTGLVLHLRRRAPRIAWTSEQARGRLVAVRAGRPAA